jgi:hypothetical protein
VSELDGVRLLLDSNLTVLLCAGMAGGGRVPRRKRLHAYDNEDFRLLAGLADKAAS